MVVSPTVVVAVTAGTLPFKLEVLDFLGNVIFNQGFASTVAAENYLFATYPTVLVGQTGCTGGLGTAGTWNIFTSAGAIAEFGCWES